MRNLKKWIAGTAAALLAAVLFTSTQVEAISAKKAIVLDGQTGRVLYAQGENDRALIASTTKIMTALIVCEQCNVLDRMKIPKEAVGIEGSSMYLQEGEVLTLQELLYGLMLRSGNDAAVALAIYCGGTVEGFAQLMNDKAHRLGMDNTHFVNPNGPDAPEHYSTAKDMAILAAYAMENPIFRQTVSTRSVTIGTRVLQNHNKLLWRVEGADGVKTGYTKAAGRILVSSTTRQGRRIIVVTMDDPNDWADHEKLIEDAFSKFTVKTLVTKGEILGTVEVAGGDAGEVELVADETFSFALRPDEKVDFYLPAPGFVYAPVVEGAQAGFAHVMVDGVSVEKISLVYGQTVERTEEKKLTLIQRIQNLFS